MPRSTARNRRKGQAPAWFQRCPWPLKSQSGFDRLAKALVNHEQSQEFHRGKVQTSLQAMRRWVTVLGQPMQGLPAIHVAGSKGKGSVCLLLEALLEGQGITTGLYTSPHLHEWRERIRIGGKSSRVSEFLGWVEHVLQEAAEAGMAAPTVFETLTAAAFYGFCEQQIEAAIVETGIGGRLDATNVLRSSVAVVTSIEREHTAILGRTLSDIAREKAGILKPKCWAVSGIRHDSAAEVIAATAQERGVKLWRLGAEIRLRRRGQGAVVGLPDLASLELVEPVVSSGPHWAVNSALALGALAQLYRWRRWGEPNWEQAIESLRTVRIPGRAERIGDNPISYRDGAHTPKSLAAICRWVALRHPGGKPVLVLGLQRDKPYLACLRAVRRWIGPLVATQVPGDRSLGSGELARCAKQLGMRSKAVADPDEAFAQARRLAGEKGSVLVSGSFWLAGALRGVRKEP